MSTVAIIIIAVVVVLILAALSVAAGLLIFQTVHIGPTIDCSSYPHHGVLAVATLFILIS